MRQLLIRYKWHILFWGLYFAFWATTSAVKFGSTPGVALALTFVWFIGQATCGYATIYRLVPKYFNKRRYLVFALLLAVVLIVASFEILGGILVVYQIAQIPPVFAPWSQFLYLLLGNCYTTFLIVSIKTIKDKIRSDKQNSVLEKEKTETELRFLKSQINPHFLFNALNSIYGLIRKDPEFAGETLLNFSDMLRYQLYECNAEVIPIEKEIDYLDNYISLEKLRKGGLVSTQFVVNSGTSGFTIAPLLLMPFVENAFKYVSACKDRQNFVVVGLSYQDGIFEMSVENSVDEEGLTSREKTCGGIGLENVRRRLELIYPGRHALDIAAQDEVYSVLLTIKLN